MKFFAAIIAFLVIGLVLGFGIFEAMQGRVWILAVGALAYLVAFAKWGCLPSSKSH